MTSVPFYPEIGVKTVQNFKKWTEIHSTVGDLKNPPKEYFNPAVDLMAEFDALIAKIQDGGVDNQYQFEAEMASITFKSYDGHYSFLGPTFAAFRWRRGGGYNRNGEYSGSYGGALISVSPSEDGSELPEVFFHCE